MDFKIYLEDGHYIIDHEGFMGKWTLTVSPETISPHARFTVIETVGRQEMYLAQKRIGDCNRIIAKRLHDDDVIAFIRIFDL